MSTSFTSIPLVDFGRLRNPETKKAELEVLRAAVFDVGFLYLVNTGLEVHGISFYGIDFRCMIDNICTGLDGGGARGITQDLCTSFRAKDQRSNAEFSAFLGLYRPWNRDHSKADRHQRGQ